MSPRRPFRPVFSIWAWLVLTPFLLFALGGVDGATDAHDWWLGAAVSLEVHGIVLLAFLAVGAVETAVREHATVRWVVVALAVGALSVGRPALISTLQGVAGLDLVATAFGPRILLNGLAFGVAVLLIHTVLESVQRTVDGRRRLLVVLEALRTQADRIDARASHVAEDFRREVRGPVLDALGGLVSRELPVEELAAELKWIAHSVVRPLSHRASDAELDDALDGLEIDAERHETEPAEQRGIRLPQRVSAPPAWVVAILGVVLLILPAINVHGPWLGLALGAGALAVAFIGGLLVRAIPRPRSRAAAMLVIGGEELVVGVATVLALIGPAHLLPIYGFYVVYGSLAFATVALIVAVLASSMRELAAQGASTAAAVAEAEHRALEARRRLDLVSRATGRILHNEVQGDLIATSLRLRLGTAGEAPLERLLERVERTLDDPVAADDASESADAIRDGIRASLNAWSLSLDLAVEVEPHALDLLGERPRAAAIAHDAMTEGLTNAVRHGLGERASVAMRVVGDAIEVRVANPGRIGPVASDGIGLRDLDARAREVSLTQVGGEVILRVVV